MNGFKSYRGYIKHIQEEKYKDIDSYLLILDSISRLTNQCVYLVDFFKGELLYVSDNPLFLAGMNVEEVKELGGSFHTKFASEESFQKVINIVRGWFRFLEQRPLEARCSYSLRYDYELKEKLISVSMTPVFLCEEGKPWLVLATAQGSTNLKCGNALLSRYNSNEIWKFIEPQQLWIPETQILLSEIEQTILRLSIQGKKETEISEEIFRSKDGLKSIKRRMFQKMNVNNITEAVSFAITSGLI